MCERLAYTSSSEMDFLLVAKAIALVTLAVANKMAFIPPNQPDTKRGSRKFGSADPISRVAHWFFHAAVVSALIAYLLAWLAPVV